MAITPPLMWWKGLILSKEILSVMEKFGRFVIKSLLFTMESIKKLLLYENLKESQSQSFILIHGKESVIVI